MRFLVTGITGTLGKAITPLLLEDGHEVVGYSRDELKQSTFPPHPNLTLYLGDVRDRDRLIEAARGCYAIFHLSAMKRIEACEENPDECVSVNVDGTKSVLHAQRMLNIHRVILSGTDKAVFPINTYGLCKSISEKLVFRNQNNVVCRWGNVLGSRGSVLPMFVKTLRENGSIDITHRQMTRFWIPIEIAAKFMAHQAMRPTGGLCIPPMRALPVMKVALLVAKILGIEVKEIRDIGMRPGEKLHEHLRTESEGGELISSDQSIWYSVQELEELLRPILVQS